MELPSCRPLCLPGEELVRLAAHRYQRHLAAVTVRLIRWDSRASRDGPGKGLGRVGDGVVEGALLTLLDVLLAGAVQFLLVRLLFVHRLLVLVKRVML